MKIALFALLFLTACSSIEHPAITHPVNWESKAMQTTPESLKNWWKHFDDPALDSLIVQTLNYSPDRLIAAARIQEARGLYRSTRASLFPQIDGSGQVSREETGFRGIDNFKQAGFDARFEIDIFGKNRNATKAASATLQALTAEYHDTSLSLAAEVARIYIEYRAAQKQLAIAEKNLESQQKTLQLVQNQFEFGEAAKLDVSRANTLVENTKATLPDYRNQSDVARLQLSVLTGLMPDNLQALIAKGTGIPSADIKPFFLAPATVLEKRPDVQAARLMFEASRLQADSVTAELLPTITLSGFYGIVDNAFVTADTLWNVFLSAAVPLIDFGRIEGRVDAARAVEVQRYQQYRRTILAAVAEVNTALSNVANINKQRLALVAARNSADDALKQSDTLFKEGEVSFLDVLDAQRTLNNTDAALVNAQALQTIRTIGLYKALGVY